MQSKIKLPTMTLNVGGSQVIVRLVPTSVNPSQVKYVNDKYFVGDLRLYGTDEVPRKPMTGFRVQIQWGKSAPWFGKKAPIFISSMAAFAQHSKSDEQAAVLITTGDNGQDLLIAVGGGDAAGSYTWWGVYSRYGLGSSFSEGPI